MTEFLELLKSPSTLVQILAVILGSAIVAAKFIYDLRRQQTAIEKIEKIEVKASEQPDKLRPAWELARTKLEAYFDRNLNQVKSIFYVGVVVMVVGFIFVLYGISRSMADSRAVPMSLVAAGAGVLTEFIGATFMLIYRSTLQQASSYMSILERINSVGMAVQILDSISGDANDTLRNSTRAELVKILLSPAYGTFAPERPQSPTRKGTAARWRYGPQRA